MIPQCASLKIKLREVVHSCATRQDARRATMRYIEAFYNRWRPHTDNDGLPPATATANF